MGGRRAKTDWGKEPLSIYEIHAGSWRSWWRTRAGL